MGRIWRRTDTGLVSDADLIIAGLRRLAAQRVELERVIDVGAFRGEWTQALHSVFPAAAALLIEPVQRHSNALAEVAAQAPAPTTVVAKLIGAEQARGVSFRVMDDESGGTGSSVLPELSGVESHQETMEMVTLAQVLDETAFGIPDLVKLDVQGYELEVLRGFEHVLPQVRFLMLEVSVRQYNAGAPLLAEIVGWLDERGFVVHDTVGALREPGDGDLLQLDLLFAQADDPIRDSFRGFDRPR